MSLGREDRCGALDHEKVKSVLTFSWLDRAMIDLIEAVPLAGLFERLLPERPQVSRPA